MKTITIIAALAATTILGACASAPQYADECITGSVEHRKSGQCVDWSTVKVGTETLTTTEVRERGVSDGSVHAKDNLTSMGNAVSDGATVVRVRSNRDQTVNIRKAGGGNFDVDVEAGDTLVEVEGPGTYIATFDDGKKKTKATGPHDFNDVTVTEEEVDVFDQVRDD